MIHHHWRCGTTTFALPVLLVLLILAPSSDNRASAASSLPLDEFRYPHPEDFNITETNWTSGYNPWMPQYTGGNPNETTYALLSGGCIPVAENGSDFSQEIVEGWNDTCEALGLECLCRPVIGVSDWNVELPPASGILQDMHHCSFEIRRILDEHRRGLIQLGGISAKCGSQDPQIYDEARELGVPLFLHDANPLTPGYDDYGSPEPDGYISVDDFFMGKTLAKVLKQLRPEGVRYAFVMQWGGETSFRRRKGFNEEMEVQPSDKDNVPVWSEIETYPYNTSESCAHMECQMEGLVQNRSVNSLIFLYQTPVKDPGFKDWVNSHRSRNLTLISVGTLDFLHYLNTGHLDGLVSQITYEYGKRSVEVLLETANKLASREISLPLKENFFETKLVSYNVIPLNLDSVHPPHLEQNLLGNLVYVGYVGLGIVLATALYCTVWTVIHRSAIVVRAAQPFFLLILLSGIVIFASTIIPLSFDDAGDVDSISETFAVGVCMSQPWLAFTGFAVMFSALFSKTWRVNRLFHQRKSHSRVRVSSQDVLAPFAVIFTSNVIILTCWTVVDPLTYTRLLGDGTDFWNRTIESYGSCRSDKALAFLLPLAAVNFTILVVACWQAFEGRSIESAFSESKYIGFAVASLFQAFLTGFPIMVLVKDEPRAFYLVLTLMILVLSEGILLLIFLPKMYMAHAYSGMTEAEQRQKMSEQISKSALHSNNQSRLSLNHVPSGSNVSPESVLAQRIRAEQNQVLDDHNATMDDSGIISRTNDDIALGCTSSSELRFESAAQAARSASGYPSGYPINIMHTTVSEMSAFSSAEMAASALPSILKTDTRDASKDGTASTSGENVAGGNNKMERRRSGPL